jgi:hypothetical protein
MIRPVEPTVRIQKEHRNRKDQGKSMIQKRREHFQNMLVKSLGKGYNLDKSI